MKAIFDYKPANSSDSTVTISSSSAMSGYPGTNLKYILPIKVWKSNSIITNSWVQYYFGAVAVTYNALLLNRFNFAAFNVQTSNDGTNWTTIETVTGLTKDEIYDEYYMHRWVDLTGSYKYLRVYIPTQTPLFEQTYFKIGNMLVGNATEIWNPRPGFAVNYRVAMFLKEFYSGYVEQTKLGRTRRVFTYNVDKISKTEYNKIRLTFQNFALYTDFDVTVDKTKAYIVRFSKEFQKTFEQGDTVSGSFELEEIV